MANSQTASSARRFDSRYGPFSVVESIFQSASLNGCPTPAAGGTEALCGVTAAHELVTTIRLMPAAFAALSTFLRVGAIHKFHAQWVRGRVGGIQHVHRVTVRVD